MRDMTMADEKRLAAHPLSRRVFKTIIEGRSKRALRVCDLAPTEYRHLRTLLELGFVNIEDGDIYVGLTISSLSRLGYL